MLRLVLLLIIALTTAAAQTQAAWIGVSSGDAEGDVAAVSLFGDAEAGHFCPVDGVCAGGVAVSGTGDASSTHACFLLEPVLCLGGAAVSGTGNATSCPAGHLPCAAASGTGDADATFAASGTGDSHGFFAASGTGDARGAEWMEGTIAVSGTGEAEGDTAVSGCDVTPCASVQELLP